MPIGLENFPQISVPDVKEPWANALHSALSTYGNLQDIEGKGYENLVNRAKSQYAQPMAQAELAKAQAEPSYIQAQTTYQKALASGVDSDIALRIAQAQKEQQDTAKEKALLPYAAQGAQTDIAEKNANIQKQNILNQNLPEREKAEIAETIARRNYYNQGGGRGGTANSTEQSFENSVLADNPQITDPIKQRELINTVLSGGKQLSDGTPVNTMSPITRNKYDAAAKARTTAQVINQNLQANQAAAELPIYKKYIDEGVAPYGTTVFGKSPQQVKDALDIHNHEAQKRLGNYLGAQQLLYDRAALMLKINALPPGQRLASKIAGLASQSIDAKYPTQSAESRQIASDVVAKALQEGLEARNKFGLSVSKGLLPEKSSSESNAPTTKWIRQNGQLVRSNS